MILKQQSKPAGMLYFNLVDTVVKANKNMSDEAIKIELKKKFRMEGIILADINIIKSMDKSLQTGKSDSIPVSLDKNGDIIKSGSNVITREQFTNIQKTAEKIIKQIAKEILEGNIDIRPIYNKKDKIDVCKNCVYKSICRFNKNVDDYLYIENVTQDEILETLAKKT